LSKTCLLGKDRYPPKTLFRIACGFRRFFAAGQKNLTDMNMRPLKPLAMERKNS